MIVDFGFLNEEEEFLVGRVLGSCLRRGREFLVLCFSPRCVGVGSWLEEE
jgi:hypothetical protein